MDETEKLQILEILVGSIMEEAINEITIPPKLFQTIKFLVSVAEKINLVSATPNDEDLAGIIKIAYSVLLDYISSPTQYH